MKTAAFTPACPGCGSAAFQDFRGRRAAQCAQCGSLERTRVAFLFLNKHVRPQAGWKVLHLAPEKHLGLHLYRLVGGGYEPADFSPKRYAGRIPVSLRRLDLCRDAAMLPSGHYDLVIHNHVLEHVPCNYTLALQHLHRSVKPGGFHLFSVGMERGYFREDLDPALSPDERQARFGQQDHVRVFGTKDFAMTIGAVLGLGNDYTLLRYFTREELLGAQVPEHEWEVSGSNVYMVRKRLRPVA